MQKMDKDKIYCCKDNLSCNCYKNDGTVSFRYQELAKGKVWEDRHIQGICCIFVLTGLLNAEVGINKIEAKSGDMFLLPSGSYKIEGKEDSGLICYTSEKLVGHCSDILMAISGKNNSWKENFSKLPVREPLDRYLQGIILYVRDGINCNYLFEVKQQEFFMLLQVCYTSEELDTFFSSLSLHQEIEIEKMILENSLKAKSVKELADICGYSLSAFKRIFKEIFNEPVYQWMLQQKTKNLKEKLTEENVNLKKIVHEFGFSSPAHLTKFCKQWLGMAPTKYIEQVKARKKSFNF